MSQIALIYISVRCVAWRTVNCWISLAESNHPAIVIDCMQNMSCLSVVRKSWLRKQRRRDVPFWFRFKAHLSVALPSSVSDWYGCILKISAIDLFPLQIPNTTITYSLLKCLTDTQFELLTNSLCQKKKKIYWAQTDIFRMSGLCKSFELNRKNFRDWTFFLAC